MRKTCEKCHSDLPQRGDYHTSYASFCYVCGEWIRAGYRTPEPPHVKYKKKRHIGPARAARKRRKL